MTSFAVDIVEEFGEYRERISRRSSRRDPSLFVIGGGVSKAGEVLLTYVEKYYRKRAFLQIKILSLLLQALEMMQNLWSRKIDPG